MRVIFLNQLNILRREDAPRVEGLYGENVWDDDAKGAKRTAAF